MVIQIIMRARLSCFQAKVMLYQLKKKPGKMYIPKWATQMVKQIITRAFDVKLVNQNQSL